MCLKKWENLICRAIFGSIRSKLSIIMLRICKKGGKMEYKKPELTRVEVQIKTNTNASDRSSCEGGHCVKATYKQDPWC
jgi:hypothetical protein